MRTTIGFCVSLLASAALVVGAWSCTDDPASTVPPVIGSGGGGAGVDEGGASGIGGTGNCSVDECPGVDSDCRVRTCNDGVCAFKLAQAGMACDDGGGQMCDDAGACVDCLAPADCGDGGDVCAQHQCVPSHCVDGTLDGSETDLDCGGQCLACGDGLACDSGLDCASGYCAEGAEGQPATCAACSKSADCAVLGEAYCSDGVCALRKVAGDLCESNGQCQSGYCPADDGVCCDAACFGSCEACLGSKTDAPTGHCSVVTDGTDPDGECLDEGAESCGSNGTGCNGDVDNPGCQLYEATTACAREGCVDGATTGPRQCDGAGVCAPTDVVSCGGYACDEAGSACLTECSDDSRCTATHYCDSAGACVEKIGDGLACAGDNQCQSGFCPDGDQVCCTTACEGLCQSCLGANTPSPDGTCDNIDDGADPFNECVLTQTCDGEGNCQL